MSTEYTDNDTYQDQAPGPVHVALLADLAYTWRSRARELAGINGDYAKGVIQALNMCAGDLDLMAGIDDGC